MCRCVTTQACELVNGEKGTQSSVLSKPELPVWEALWHKEWNGEVKFGNHSNVSCLLPKSNRNQGGEGGHQRKVETSNPGQQ